MISLTGLTMDDLLNIDFCLTSLTLDVFAVLVIVFLLMVAPTASLGLVHVCQAALLCSVGDGHCRPAHSANQRSIEDPLPYLLYRLKKNYAHISTISLHIFATFAHNIQVNSSTGLFQTRKCQEYILSMQAGQGKGWPCY